MRLTYEQCEQVLAPSRYMCQYLHSIGIAHASCSRSASTSRRFRPRARGRDLRAELELPPDTRLLVFAGRFSAEKNIPMLLEAFRKLGEPLSPAADRRRRVAAATGNVTRLPYCRDNRELAGYHRVRRCIRACRRARNLRPGGARGDGVRASRGGHARGRGAGARSTSARACSPSRTQDRGESRPRISPRRLPRCTSAISRRSARAARAARGG